MFREVLRIISITPNYDVWILSKQEVGFYNLIFAIIAVIVGQSMTFSFWYDRPRNFFSFNKIRCHSIVNDQRGLNWYFMLWFGKIGIIYGLLFGVTLHSFDSVSLYPDYCFFFVLLVLVLFFNSWQTLRLKYKNNGLKLMILSFFIVFSVSFLLSKINLIDYDSINKKLLKRNIYYTYNLQLAESDSSYMYGRIFDVIDLYMVLPNKDEGDTEPLFVVKSGLFNFEQMQDSLKKLIETTGDNPFVKYRLFVDKNVKIKDVIKLENELSNANDDNLVYAVVSQAHGNSKFYQNQVLLSGKLKFADIHKLKVLDTKELSFEQYLRILGL